MHSGANSSALMVALILSSGSFVSVANAALPELTPTPQQMRWTSGAESHLAARAIRGVVIDAALPANMAALERLSKALHRSLSPTPDGNLKLVLGGLPATIPDRNRREAYVLVVDRNGATITAETAHGIHHGLISLALLADSEKGIPCVTISDWPDQQIRGTYVPGVEQAEARFDQFVALKLNLLLLEDPRLYDLDNPEIACNDATGDHTLQLTLSNKGTVRAGQELAVQAQSRYRVHCRIKTRDVEGDGAYLEVYGIDAQGAGTLIGQNNVHVRGTTDWQDSSVVIDTSWGGVPDPWAALEFTAEHTWSFGPPKPAP